MNSVKKYITAIITACVLFTLIGCGDKEDSKTFNWTDGKTELSLTYYYKDDTVLRQTAKNKIQYATLGVTNKEGAKQHLEPISEKYKAIKGVTENIDYQDTYATETLTVDYTRVDYEVLHQVQGTAFSGDIKHGVSMLKSQELLEKNGFKEVK